MKLFRLLESLSKEELKMLNKAVQSPIFKPTKQALSLFKLLRPQHPNYEDTILFREKLFTRLFPKEVYYDYKLRRVFTELTKLIEHMLLQQDIEQHPFDRQKQLYDIYRRRGLYSLFKKGTKDLLKELEGHPIQNVDYHREQKELLEAQYFHPLYKKEDVKDQIVDQIEEHLDTYFILSKLRLAIALKANAQVMKKEFKVRFLEAIKKIVEGGFQKDNILLDLYLQALTLSEEMTQQVLMEYEKKLFSTINTFDPIDQKFLYYSGINNLLKVKNNGVKYGEIALFRWHLFGIANNLILEQNKIVETTFANIVISGAQSSTIEWVSDFIENYKQYLEIKDKESAILYYYGIVYYVKKEWEIAFDYLTRSEKKSIFPPRNRSMLIRIVFEQFLLDHSYFDLLLSKLQSFETYIRRDKHFSKGRLDAHLQFTSFTRRLANRIYDEESPIMIKSWFKEAIKETVPSPTKKWLVEKVENL